MLPLRALSLQNCKGCGIPAMVQTILSSVIKDTLEAVVIDCTEQFAKMNMARFVLLSAHNVEKLSAYVTSISEFEKLRILVWPFLETKPQSVDLRNKIMDVYTGALIRLQNLHHMLFLHSGANGMEQILNHIIQNATLGEASAAIWDNDTSVCTADINAVESTYTLDIEESGKLIFSM